MSRPKTYPYCFTLRLPSAMESDLDDLAYDWRQSKAGTIRQILGGAIAETYQHPAPDEEFCIGGGQL